MSESSAAQEPEQALIATLVRLWSKVLGCECDENSDLFDLGGDSLSAMQLVDEVRNETGRSVLLDSIIDEGTPLELARGLMSS